MSYYFLFLFYLKNRLLVIYELFMYFLMNNYEFIDISKKIIMIIN